MSENPSFFNLYRHNFVRISVAIPTLRVADPAFNARETIALLRRADEAKAMIALFPELGLSAYSCDDLFHQQALQNACVAALAEIIEASRELTPVAVVGLPLQVDGALYNCAAVVHRGRLLGVVPKSYMPNYREYYERRQFAPASSALRSTITLCGQADVPFGAQLLFRPSGQPLATFHVEICEDLWVPIPPSSFAALAGAAVLLNLSASNVTIGKADYRRELVGGQSARCIAAYAYSAAGYGESTTDLAWDGHGLVCENGTLLVESQRFSMQAQLIVADVDLDRLHQDRAQTTTFSDSMRENRAALVHRTIDFELDVPDEGTLLLQRSYARIPYVPSDPARRRERCEEIMAIQSQGLVKRMQSAHVDKLVIGISGGLDSAHALLVCARAVDALGLPRSNILAYTLPGFATGERTLGQARRLMSAIGATAAEIDIRPAAMALLKSIGHPFAEGEPVYDLAFENVQAGERTNHLFRLAGMHNAMVVGTSDLSELALGWCTYGVGDHMAHYHVNASVPKTLVQHLVRWGSESGEFDAEMSQALLDVLETEISPELVPSGGTAATGSEATVGPYPLQDFHLYYTLRFGYSPTKVAFLAWHAWHEHGFDIAAIRQWLRVFALRFFQLSQYKRSCIANAPKVGSGGSLSPRGDWRAPSDAQADVWLREIDAIPETPPPVN